MVIIKCRSSSTSNYIFAQVNCVDGGGGGGEGTSVVSEKQFLLFLKVPELYFSGFRVTGLKILGRVGTHIFFYFLEKK